MQHRLLLPFSPSASTLCDGFSLLPSPLQCDLRAAWIPELRAPQPCVDCGWADSLACACGTRHDEREETPLQLLVCSASLNDFSAESGCSAGGERVEGGWSAGGARVQRGCSAERFLSCTRPRVPSTCRRRKQSIHRGESNGTKKSVCNSSSCHGICCIGHTPNDGTTIDLRARTCGRIAADVCLRCASSSLVRDSP